MDGDPAAAQAVNANDLQQLAEAVKISHQTQLDEGMQPLPEEPSALAAKYCGGGYGGYALYLFAEQKDRDAFVANNEAALAIEPYLKPFN